ncbi:hypothetical protein SAMN05216480_10537 [Pustulibacterium marinum]|uniref:Phage abortive infection protein n=1 Tax=Pustulibacterium marinum TaxID=1224947 RepID=A0A1I7GKS8_9FLAO|nr:hypothetical protein [Pustulibacterium marinum]SFU49029.1 hypothetical protein SAMN05216480_10537 [Pustulibacterium marinum]
MKSRDREKEQLRLDIGKTGKWIFWFRLFGFIFIGIGFISIFATLWLYKTHSGEYSYFANDLGHFTGGVAASLFSLSGLFFIYVAFLGQKQQIMYQRIELIQNEESLAATRLEVKNQVAEMKLQNSTLKKQEFENHFFRMMENHRKIISEKYIRDNKNILEDFLWRFDIATLINLLKYDLDDPDFDQDNFERFKKSLINDLRYVKGMNTDFIRSIFLTTDIVNSIENEVEQFRYKEILFTGISDMEFICIYIICIPDNLTELYRNIYQKNDFFKEKGRQFLKIFIQARRRDETMWINQ